MRWLDATGAAEQRLGDISASAGEILAAGYTPSIMFLSIQNATKATRRGATAPGGPRQFWRAPRSMLGAIEFVPPGISTNKSWKRFTRATARGPRGKTNSMFERAREHMYPGRLSANQRCRIARVVCRTIRIVMRRHSGITRSIIRWAATAIGVDRAKQACGADGILILICGDLI